MNRYKVLLPVLIDGEYGQGDEFEKELTPEDEAANVASGLLAIVPQKYKVVGGSKVFETNPGDVFTRALSLGEEAALVAGGHIERVAAEATKRPQKEKES